MTSGGFGLSLGALALVLAASATAGAQTPRPERPVYRVGEQWVLADGVYELTKADKDGYLFTSAGARQIFLTRDLTVTRISKAGRIEWDLYPAPGPSWPLDVGKWGVANGVLRNSDNPGGANVRITWRVKSFDDVRVPAGAFKAFQITHEIEADIGGLLRGAMLPGGRHSWSVTTWYAPDAQRIVKTEAWGVEALDLQVVSVDAGKPGVRLVLDQPGDQARVTSQAVNVQGRLRSPGGTARVTATVNGVTVPRWDGHEAPAGDSPIAIAVTLREGRNVVLVTAVDAAGTTQQASRVIVYERPAAPPASAPPATPATAASPPAAPEPGTVRIAISAPRDQARVEHDSVALAGVVTADRSVKRVVVTLNGVDIAHLADRTPGASLALNVPLRLREGDNTVVVTATDAEGRLQQDVRSVHYEPLAPLAVQIRHPEDRARLTDDTSVMAALVTSSKGVSAVTVTLNGKEVFREAPPAAPRSVAVTAPLKLREGTNVVVMTATERDGATRQEMRTIVYARPPLTPAAPAPVARDRWAVVVGVGRYDNADVPPLRFPVRDAEAVAEVLIERAGFKKDNVLLITDRTERKPTLRNLKWAFGTFLARSAKKDDLVLIYFAGHGAPEIDPRGIESDGFAKYLVPSDADPNDLYATGLPMDELQTIFDRIEAERIIVFLDACYSGAAGGRTFASKRTRAAKVDDIFLERLTRSSGRAIITAARASEVSVELPELGHGVFTHYLIQGLRGTADLDRDGIISLQELYQYLEQEVSRKSRGVGANQHPVMKGEVDGLMPLVKVAR
jgi:caspase domain-containing protein/glucodextranase-like protein